MKFFLIFFLAMIVLFLGIDYIQKRLIRHVSWSRKATHILSGGIIYLMPYWLDKWQIFWMGILFVVILAVSKREKLLSLHAVERKTWGEIIYPASISLLSLICLPDNMKVFQVSCLVLAVSDGLAGILGEAWNFYPVTFFHNTKSIGGAIVFFLSTLGIILIFHTTEANIPVFILVSFLLTITEFVLYFGSDNIGVPVVAALLELNFIV